jgi:prepilin-type processing-associated H-X9-DG protein
MRTVLALFAGALLALPVQGGDAASEGHARAVAPYVDDLTFLIVHVDVSRINFDVLAKYMDTDNVEKNKAVATLAKTTFLRSGGKDLYVLMNWGPPVDEVLLVAPLAEDAAGSALVTLMRQLGGFEAIVKDNVLLAGTKKGLARLKLMKSQPAPDLAKALAAVGDGTAQVVFLPPFPLKRAFVEMFPELPKEIGGGNTSVLDFQWAAARIDAGEKLGAKLVLQAPSAKSAETIAKVFERALAFAAQLAKSEDVKRSIPDIVNLAAVLTPKVQADRLTVVLNDKDLTTVLLPLIEKRRHAAGRAQSMNNLKQIALAMHNYHDVNKALPAAATYDAEGHPLLSWRVHILPFIEQDALYRSFHLNEPWDSEHNKKLIAKMPPTYRSPALKDPQGGKTTYLAPVGPKTIFGGKKGMPFQKITDGTSNTVLVVETDDSRGVYWTQPDDYKIDAKNPMAGLVQPGASGFNAAFADGSVRFLQADIDPATLRALFTANGGEQVNAP